MSSDGFMDKALSLELLELAFRPQNLATFVLAIASVFGAYMVYSWRFMLHASVRKRERRAARLLKYQQRITAKAQRQGQKQNKSTKAWQDAEQAVLVSTREEKAAAAAAAGPGAGSTGADGMAGGADEEKGTSAAAAAPGKTDAPRLVGLVETIVGKHSQEYTSLQWELLRKDNAALALSMTSFIAGVCYIIAGVQTDALMAASLLQQIVQQFIWTGFGFVLYSISNLVSDRLLLRKYLSTPSLLMGNMATGLVECGQHIGTAMIVRTCVSGEGTEDFWGDIAVTCIYFVLGHIALVLSFLVLQAATYLSIANCQEQCRQGNPAAGLKMAVLLISMSIIISQPISRSDSLAGFAIYVGLGFILQCLAFVFLSLAVLPQSAHVQEILQQNWGLQAIEAGILISLAMACNTFWATLGCAANTAAGA